MTHEYAGQSERVLPFLLNTKGMSPEYVISLSKRWLKEGLVDFHEYASILRFISEETLWFTGKLGFIQPINFAVLKEGE